MSFPVMRLLKVGWFSAETLYLSPSFALTTFQVIEVDREETTYSRKGSVFKGTLLVTCWIIQCSYSYAKQK